MSDIGDRNYIKVGDFVNVAFNSSQITLYEKAKVVRLPDGDGNTGSWIFKDINGQLSYVSEGCTVQLLLVQGF